LHGRQGHFIGGLREGNTADGTGKKQSGGNTTIQGLGS